MAFPKNRMRRLRQNGAFRDMVRETVLNIEDLIYPMFVSWGSDVKNEISSMPGIYRYSLDMLPGEIKELQETGINAVILFGIPEYKDDRASSAYDTDGIIQQAIKVFKDTAPEILVITDVCLCEYTDHGHCGIVKENEIDNDLSLNYLARTSLSHAHAGADMVAPSDMMDGRVSVIRDHLDKNGYENLPIMSYSAKYSSSFFGPFREAADSAPQFGDRRTYQMDSANGREALREVELDIEEGADIVMIKPALAYMDVITKVRKSVSCPVAAYSVSGEYSMFKAAAQKGWLNEKDVVLESLTGLKRAGADIIITYYAKEAAKWL